MRDRPAVGPSLVLAAGGLGFALYAAHGGEPGPLFALLCCAAAASAARLAGGQRERVEQLSREVEQLRAALSRERAARQLLQIAQRRVLQELPEPVGCLERAASEAVARLSKQRSWPELGQTVLSVLAEHGSVQSAALFAADRAGRALLEAPVARLGALPATVRHVLIERALQSGKLAMPADPTSLSAATADVLAALPLGYEGRVLGVVAVQRLPFEAYEPQHLSELALLLQPLAAAIAHAVAADTSSARTPHAATTPARWGMIA